MRVEVTQNLEQIHEMLRKLKGEKLKGALQSIGEAGVSLAQQSFSESKDPEGNTWAPIKPYYRYLSRGGKGRRARRRFRPAGAKPLMDTGATRNSFNYQVRSNGVEIGSPKAFLKYHHPGSPSKGIMPMRASLPDGNKPLPKAWQTEILDTLEGYLEVS
jgi:hypothetical protein